VQAGKFGTERVVSCCCTPIILTHLPDIKMLQGQKWSSSVFSKKV